MGQFLAEKPVPPGSVLSGNQHEKRQREVDQFNSARPKYITSAEPTRGERSMRLFVE
jgi:hypothetical protein